MSFLLLKGDELKVFLIDLLFVIVITVLLTALIGGSYRSRGSGALLLFFLILFVGTWGIGVWLTPIGPALFGGYWLSFLIVGIFIALIMAAIPDGREHSREDSKVNVHEQDTSSYKSLYAFNAFFWFLIVLLSIWIIAYYI